MNLRTIDQIYNFIKNCDEIKFDKDIKDILDDIELIDNSLKQQNQEIMEQVFRILYNKYKDKLNEIGFDTYNKMKTNLTTDSSLNFQNNGNNILINDLNALKNWLIEYAAYKVLKHKIKGTLEEYTINNYKNSIKTYEELQNKMNDIDIKILNKLKGEN